MYQRLHDPHAGWHLLDDSRRFFFNRLFVLAQAGERLVEMRIERDRYLGTIDGVLHKHGIDRDKALARLKKRGAMYGVQLTEELATVVRTAARLEALESVIDQYETFGKMATHEQCIGTGSLVGKHDGNTIGLVGQEFKTLTTPFNRERFEEQVGDPVEQATTMGVGTAIGHGHQGIHGLVQRQQPEAVGVGSLVHDDGHID